MSARNPILKKISQRLQAANAPLLVCHVAPDGDAIGGLTGLGQALHGLGKRPTLACADPVPAHFHFIPAAETIVHEITAPFDLVVALDCSDISRIGGFVDLPAFKEVPLINIDHHLTNRYFGDENLINASVASTCEIVLQLLEYMALPIDVDIATSLLTGIVTDTRGFRTNNVTANVLQAALRLMERGASLPQIAYYGLDRRPTEAILLWGAALAQLEIEDGIIWTAIPLSMRQSTGHTGNGDAGLVSFLIGAEDADAAAVFTELADEQVDVSLRATAGFDVSQVALQFGGGGHALASGCTVQGSLEDVQERVLAALETDLTRQRQSDG